MFHVKGIRCTFIRVSCFKYLM